MIRTNGNRRGFTLVELLVVVGMIAVILGAISTSVTAAQNRARIQKATSEVKVITQAILAYENYMAANDRNLPTLKDADADSSNIGFLLGSSGQTASGERVPTLLMAALQSGGKMRDPWGMPYRVSITKSSGTIKSASSSGNLQTGYFLPNFYRLNKGERDIWAN